MKVSVLTSGSGGTYQWGRGLADALRGKCDTRHIYTRLGRMSALVYQNADIVHTTFPFYFRLWRKPIVLTIKADYTREFKFYRKLYLKMIAEADAITTPSYYMKDKLELGRAVVIPNAVSPDRFKVASHDVKNRLKLATVTNFNFEGKAKGLVDLVVLLRKVWQDGYEYTVVGSGAYLGMVKGEACDSKLGVNFVGFHPHPEMVLAGSDIFLYYSYQDNFPHAILEAMASGLPVITNNVGAVSEIIDNGRDGFVAETPEEYMKYFRELADNVNLRRDMGFRARQSVVEKFNWDALADKYLEIYKRLNWDG